MKSLSQKAAMGGLAALVPIVLCGVVGMWSALTLSGDLTKQKTGAGLLRAHVHADMLHDAIRADVVSALASFETRAHLKLEDAAASLGEHADGQAAELMDLMARFKTSTDRASVSREAKQLKQAVRVAAA